MVLIVYGLVRVKSGADGANVLHSICCRRECVSRNDISARQSFTLLDRPTADG